MLELRLALRFLRMAGKRAHTAFLSLISLLGIAVGVATVIISIALLSGMQEQVRDRLRRETPHLVIEPKAASSIAESEDLLERLEAAGVETRSIIAGTGWAAPSDGSSGRPVHITSWPGRTEDTPAGNKALVSIDLASALDLSEGDELILVSPRTRLTPFGEVPVWQQVEVGRILLSTPTEESSAVIIAFDEASRFFSTAGHPTRIEVRSTPEDATALAGELGSQYEGLLFRDWEELNRPLFLALKLERVVMFATISLVVLVAALNLVSSLAMTIVEKRKQVGILTTLGATSRSIGLSFLLLGLTVALGGAILGTVLGVGFSVAADTWDLVTLPGMPEPAPLVVEPSDVVEINLIALLLAAASTLYPAWAATRLTPQEALREE